MYLFQSSQPIGSGSLTLFIHPDPYHGCPQNDQEHQDSRYQEGSNWIWIGTPYPNIEEQNSAKNCEYYWYCEQ